MTEQITLLYDTELKRPGCVILQALAGCRNEDLHMVGFDSKDWLVSPTPGMKKITGTREQWERAARGEQP